MAKKTVKDAFGTEEFLDLIKKSGLTLHTLKKIFVTLFDNTRIAGRSRHAGAFGTRNKKIKLETVSGICEEGMTKFRTFLSDNGFYNNNLGNTVKLLEYLNAAIKAGVSKQSFIFLVNNYQIKYTAVRESQFQETREAETAV